MKKKTEKFHKQFSTVARQARLEELEALTGCPIAMVIEGQCQEAGCQNQLLSAEEKIKTPIELCYRLQILVENDCALLEESAFKDLFDEQPKEKRSQPKAVPKPVIDTRLRQRCVL